MKNLILQKMETQFQSDLPENLYLNHYELSEKYDGTPSDWRNFLREPHINQFIESEVATIAEAEARHALRTLSSSKRLQPGDISALKQVIDNSKLLKQKNQNKKTIILTNTPRKQRKDNRAKHHSESGGN